jgi:hypothetical protein
MLGEQELKIGCRWNSHHWNSHQWLKRLVNFLSFIGGLATFDMA